jgi:acetaldehyde dehydrogenase/alcohol dehydrogenase
MHHPDINLILATGGPGMVKAAYSSGKPAIGVGAVTPRLLLMKRLTSNVPLLPY